MEGIYKIVLEKGEAKKPYYEMNEEERDEDIANHEVAKLFYSKIEKKETFAIETNLCDLETYKSFIGVQGLGYEVNIFFLS